jgi:quercetin dioxygenase-like cupin family protein
MLHIHGSAATQTVSDVGQISGGPPEQRMLLNGLLEAPGVRVAAAVFQPGARTGWHWHEGGQLFLIEHGQGIVVSEDSISLAGPGDLIYAPPGERHWHGAGPSSLFVYTVISLGATTWLDQEVVENEYLAALG